MLLQLPLDLVHLTLHNYRLHFSRSIASAILSLPRISLNTPSEPLQEERPSHKAEPFFSEEYLYSVYTDLLSVPQTQTRSRFRDSIPNPQETVHRLRDRLGNPSVLLPLPPDSLSSKLTHRLIPNPSTKDEIIKYTSNGESYSELICRLQDHTSTISALPAIGRDSSISIMTQNEWAALIQACLDASDMSGLHTVLQLIKREQGTPSQELVEHVLATLARKGLYTEVQQIASTYMNDLSQTRYLEFLLLALCKCRLFTTARNLLHTQEERGIIPSMDAYKTIIRGLLKSPGPGQTARQARAWDIFANMRYVAHPTPSSDIYAEMIQACAQGPEVDTIRAQDLFIEMTVDKGIQPTVRVYNALITVLSRHMETANEAFRLANQMVEFGRDAEGNPALPPTSETYVALLDAAKRLGNISQTRWALTKLSQIAAAGGPKINHRHLRHVFQAYASYTPPFKRSMVQNSIVDGLEEPTTESAENSLTPDEGPLSYSLPQTSQQLIAEVDTLFENAVESTKVENPDHSTSILDPNINLDFLIGPYLSVYFSNVSILDAIGKFRAVHEALEKNVGLEAIKIALFKCAHLSARHRSDTVFQFSRNLWAGFRQHLSKSLEDGPSWILNERITPEDHRQTYLKASTITQIWSEMMHLLVMFGHRQDAVRLVREFAELFPPAEVSRNLSAETLVDSKVSLSGSRALVRLSERGMITDDTVPPLLLFKDVSFLHKELLLVGESGRKDLRYLTWLLHAYEGHLKDRRSMNLFVEDTVRSKNLPDTVARAKVAGLQRSKRKRSPLFKRR